MEKRKLAEQVHVPGKAWVLAGLFLAGLVLAGGKAVFGMFPFGLAAASSASGFLGAAAVFLGALLGSAGAGGVLPLVTVGVFVLRAGVSMWLAADGDSFPLGRDGRKANRQPGTGETILRHSRTSGWIRSRRFRWSEKKKIPPEEEPDPPAAESAGWASAGWTSAGASERKTERTSARAAAGAEKADLHAAEAIPKRRKYTPDARIPLHGGAAAARQRGSMGRIPTREELLTLAVWADKKLFMEHVALRMALSALANLTAGAFALVQGGYRTGDLWGAVFSVLLSPLCTYLFYAAHDRHMRTSAFREAGILSTLAILCCSLSGTTLPFLGFNLGEGAALTAAVLTGGSFGVARGGLVGLTCGLFLEPMYAPAFALAGAVTGAFAGGYSETAFTMGQGYSRAFGLFAGSTAAVIWSVYSGGFSGLAGLVPEILMVTAALLPFYAYDKCRLPAHWCGVLPDTRRSERTAVAEMALAGREKKLTALGDGMQSLGEMLGGVSEKLVRPGRREMQDLAESCFDVYCSRCAQRTRCREQDFAQWQTMLTRFSGALTEDGGVCAADVPAALASRCAVMGRVLDEINGTAARRMGERRSGDRLRVAAEDYTHMGRLLAESARLEEEEGTPDRELTVKLERVLSCHDFAAGSVSVYGTRHKRIFVHDVDLTGTRMGGEEIAALFGKAAGMPLSIPTFSLNGSVLSMEMHSVQCARCEWGKSTRSAASLTAVSPVQPHFSTGSVQPSDTAAPLCSSDIPAESPQPPETQEFSTGSFSAPTGFRTHFSADRDPTLRRTHAEAREKIPSGDTVSAFTGDGKQYMLLSDGMGTGRMAALTSGMAAVFLERMLTAGATMETALKMLNSVIRAGCDECAATVDLCEIDLVTMEARFVKSGAAPSFVIRGGSLFRLQSKTVPIGILRALDAEMIRFTVEPGDVVVMLSDGIARSFEECPWLLDFLSTDEDIQHGNVQRAAEKIVEQAASRGARDDITAGVLRILR